MTLTWRQCRNQRGRVILLPDLIALIEGSDRAALAAAGERLLGDEKLRSLGAKPDIARGIYQLEYSIQNLA